MTTPSTAVIAGIDVGKGKLDAHFLHANLDREFNDDEAGPRALRKHGARRVSFEPTGRCHRKLHQCLFDSGVDTVLVNPMRSRRFAEAIGSLAKMDRVETAMMAPCSAPSKTSMRATLHRSSSRG